MLFAVFMNIEYPISKGWISDVCDASSHLHPQSTNSVAAMLNSQLLSKSSVQLIVIYKRTLCVNCENHSSSLFTAICIGFIVGANFERALILSPYFQNIMGMGTKRAATQPKSVPDQFTLMASNMYVLKSGKTAPARERRKVFPAIAEAALRRTSLV